MSDHIETESIQLKAPLPEKATGYEFNTEQDIVLFMYEGEETLSFTDDENHMGIPEGGPEEEVKSIIWDAIDREAVERDIDENNPITVGRIRVQTSSESSQM